MACETRVSCPCRRRITCSCRTERPGKRGSTPPEQDKLAPPEALRRAQCWLRDATNADLDAYLSQHEVLALARLQQAERMPLVAVHALLGQVLTGDPTDRPYSHPYYWAPFVFYGAEEAL